MEKYLSERTICVLWRNFSNEFPLNTGKLRDFPAIISINLDKLNRNDSYLDDDDIVDDHNDVDINNFREQLRNTFKDRNLLYDDPLTFELTLAIQNSHCEVREIVLIKILQKINYCFFGKIRKNMEKKKRTEKKE